MSGGTTLLNFVGCGNSFSGFNGNNSAYLRFNKTLFLIDCGSANFGRMIRAKLLEGIDRIDVLVTHLHPDHVGSLGSLILYTVYQMAPMSQVKLTVLVPEELRSDLATLLRLQGVTEDKYHLTTIPSAGFETDFGFQVHPVPVTHAKELICFGYILKFQTQSLYYSGDAAMIPREVVHQLAELDYVYQDTCIEDYPGNVHMSLQRICEMIPVQYRHKVYCMHLDDNFPVHQAAELGFKVASPVSLL